MIDVNYLRTMARYTGWQNNSLITAANTISDAERTKQRGAFFGSIQGTMNHLLWGDRIWMHRFSGSAQPDTASISESINETNSWASYCADRAQMDVTIADWAKNLDASWLEGDLSWFSGAVNRTVNKPKQSLVVHMFNHGTHHRGQIHAMLTAAGASPDDTDLPFLPD